MTDRIAQQIDLAALLNTFVYLDNDVVGIEGGTLREILQIMGMNMDARGDEAKPEYLQLKAALQACPELGDVVLVDRSSTNETAAWTDDLIQAVTFRDAEGNYYVAYRGTGEGRWADNGDGMTAESTQMQRAAASYFDSVAEKYLTDAHARGAEVIVTGHSKGGNESQYVTVAADYEYLIDRCYSFDGQGFSEKAVASFRARYGEEYYERQLDKMYAVCGENDFVHGLGHVIIPPSRTYYVPTTGSGMTAWHHICNMIGVTAAGAASYAGLGWERAQDGGYLHGTQGSVGELTKVLSAEMMAMDEEDLHGTAVALMWGIDYFCMAENREEWEMLGDVDLKASDFVDLIAHGAPAVAEVLTETPEGRKVLRQLAGAVFGKAYDTFGCFGVAGVAALFVLLAGPVKKLLGLMGKLKKAAQIGDRVFDLLEEAKRWAGKAREAVASIQRVAAEKLGRRLTAAREASPGAGQADDAPLLSADLERLREFAARTVRCKSRLGGIDERVGRLYRRTGLLGLLGLMNTAVLPGAEWRLGQCGTWLYAAADRLERAEGRIRKEVCSLL